MASRVSCIPEVAGPIAAEMDEGEHWSDLIAVSYAPDDAQMGKLNVRTRFGGFAGRGEAWVGRYDVSAFAERLRQYPLDPDSPVVLSAGLGAGNDYIEFIGLTVAPRGTKGQVIVSVHLAAEEWRDGGPVPIHEARIEYPTSYESLRQFSADLHVALDHGGEACLEAETLS